jgi:tetratricopeptide (TPR) repeat protein
MTLLVTEPHNLVAPLESLVIRPSTIIFGVSAISDDFPAPPSAPTFLIRARELAERFPDTPVALARLAQAELAVQSHEAALDAARQALALASKQSDHVVAIAAIQVLFAEGKEEEAEATIRSLPASETQAVLLARIYAQRGELDEALAALAGISTVDAFMMSAWIALEKHSFSEAIRLYRRALVLGGPNSDALANVGYAYAAIGALSKAISSTLQARELDRSSELILLNLASYYRAQGNLTGALSAILRYQKEHGGGVGLVFAEADLRLSMNDPRGAENTLRRVRTSEAWVDATLQERAELEANLTYVRWRLGKQSRSETLSELVRQLERTEFASLEIASMLPALLKKSEDAERLAGLLSRLKDAHPTQMFYRLQVQLAILKFSFGTAVDIALEWNEKTDFDPMAPSMAVYLLTDVAARPTEAVELGLQALPKFPGFKPLINNLGYALALAGDYGRARRLLPDETDDVHLIATRGLVELLSGRTDEGLAAYDRAESLANKQGDEELTALVRYNRVLFLTVAMHRQHDSAEETNTLELPSDWEDDPNLVLLAHIAEREGVPYIVAD